jgi:NADH:ubiquinone oxidoreductase subunit 5 (subunit L)/multisubunit Na+/H+ antiporter MnhA subunit
MNLLNFIWMITIPLIASPVVYLSGRLGTHEAVLQRRSYLVRGLALLAILLAWVPFVFSVRTFLTGGLLEFNIESIWLRVDGISLLVAAMVLVLGTMVILFSGPYMLVKWARKNTMPCFWR